MPRQAIRMLDATALRAAITPAEAVRAVREALVTGGFDPEAETPRVAVPLRSGEMLLMPAEADRTAGVKIATVAPANPASGRPRIQGLYLLLDGDHLEPVAVLDGAELTLIRTSAVSAFAVAALLEADPRHASGSIGRLLVYGTGPQAERHIRSLVATVRVGDIAVAGRRPAAVAVLRASLGAEGIVVRAADDDDLGRADVVICATSSSTPVFPAGGPSDRVIVAAVGAHGLGHREVPPEFARRALVVVESVASALREGGDLIPARPAHEWPGRLSTLAELARREVVVDPEKPILYTGVGMGWQDLAVARRAVGGPGLG